MITRQPMMPTMPTSLPMTLSRTTKPSQATMGLIRTMTSLPNPRRTTTQSSKHALQRHMRTLRVKQMPPMQSHRGHLCYPSLSVVFFRKSRARPIQSDPHGACRPYLAHAPSTLRRPGLVDIHNRTIKRRICPRGIRIARSLTGLPGHDGRSEHCRRLCLQPHRLRLCLTSHHHHRCPPSHCWRRRLCLQPHRLRLCLTSHRHHRCPPSHCWRWRPAPARSTAL